MDGQALPKALREVAAYVEHYGTFPRAVFALITGYILEVVFGFVGVIAASVLLAFDYVVGALEYARAALLGVFGPAGAEFLGWLAGLQATFAEVTAMAGPAAPLVAVALSLGFGYAVLRVGILVVGNVPLLGAIVGALGVR